MSSAYSDIGRDETIGASTIELLYQTVAAVARKHRFPPPAGQERWTKDAVQETAHDFFVARGGVSRIEQLYRLAFDDESFDRLVHQAVRNHLRSIARATDRGALIRRIKDVLVDDPRFVALPVSRGESRWTLAATGVQEPYTGQLEPLIAAAWEVEGVHLLRWRSETRRTPIEGRSLGDVCEAVLRAAATSMTAPRLAEVVALRFNLTAQPVEVELDDEVPGPETDIESTLVIDETAVAIWDQLTVRERTLFPYRDEPVRVAAEHAGAGKSQTAVHLARLEKALTANLARDPHGEQILEALDILARQWADRTRD